jgi:hypothetical protein
MASASNNAQATTKLNPQDQMRRARALAVLQSSELLMRAAVQMDMVRSADQPPCDLLLFFLSFPVPFFTSCPLHRCRLAACCICTKDEMINSVCSASGSGAKENTGEKGSFCFVACSLSISSAPPGPVCPNVCHLRCFCPTSPVPTPQSISLSQRTKSSHNHHRRRHHHHYLVHVFPPAIPPLLS